MNAVVSKFDITSVVDAEIFVSGSDYSAPLDCVSAGPSLRIQRIDDLDTLMISKGRAGFERESVDALTKLLAAISEGRIPDLKYLVFDFAHRDEETATAADGFDELASANARLILDAPVISIAWARSYLNGADLDFALTCSMLAADRAARFSFDVDLAQAHGLYGTLSQKLGFVKAERLLENGAVLSPEQMQELCLVRHIVESEEGIEGAERYVRQCGRRYNASYSMFRAQRIATPPVRRQIAPAAPPAIRRV
jgi:enoyl-CoA hydratase/carnithine racemase